MPDQNSRLSGALLTVDVEEDGDALLISASGELDISTTGALDAELQRALDGKATRVILDLSGLSFVDSTGLRLLAIAVSHAKANGTQLRMRDGSEAVKRTLQVTGLDHTLPLTD